MLRPLVSTVLLSSALIATSASATPWSKCGIGAMVFESNGALAAISNIIWDLGTTAVTSDVSSKSWCNGRGGRSAMFIHESYNNILEETAIGEGEHLVAMLGIMDCRQENYDTVLAGIRIDVAEQISSPAYSSMSHMKKSQAYHASLISNSAICSA